MRRCVAFRSTLHHCILLCIIFHIIIYEYPCLNHFTHGLVQQSNQRSTGTNNIIRDSLNNNISSTKSKNHLDISVINQQNVATSYASYWDKILTDEYRAAVEELKEKRTKWSRARLEATGMSIFGASAEPDSEVYGDKIVRVTKSYGLNGKLLRDNFARGDVLVMTQENDGLGRTLEYPVAPRECLVVDVGDNWLTVAVGNSWPLGLWESRRKNTGAFLVRLDRTAAQAPMKAQKNALDLLRQNNAGKAAMIFAGLAYNETNTVTEHYLSTARQTAQYFHSSDEQLENDIWNAIEDTRNAITFKPNQSQMDAIAFALKRRVSLIRGPPGTGKTRCAAMLIATALKMQTITKTDVDDNKDKPLRVLAVTHSNGAADVLLEALLNIGVPAVRLGRPSSVSPSVQHRTVLAIADKIPGVKRLRQKVADMTLDSQSRSAAEFDLKQYMVDTQKAILQTAPVIVASCIGSYQLIDENVTFPIVVLDESAQTTEPALICSLAVAKADQVVLIGDTRQLPPTITSTDLRDTLGISPMSRLEKIGVDEVTLKIQYRMCPPLLEHPSKYFYGGLVSCTNNNVSESKANKLPQGFPWPNSLPLTFINSGENNEIIHNYGGRSNPTEVNMVIRIIKSLIDHGDLNARELAIITPYSKQVQAIRMELSMLDTRSQHQRFHQVKVGTVDSFQGQEADLVIFSAVRSNDLKELGFLRDSRRLNVAITRAKKGLVLIGDTKLLRTCRHWSALLDSCERRGCCTDISILDSNENQRLVMPEVRREIGTTERSSVLHLDDPKEEFYGLFS
jgi:hypothetical protein